MVIVFAGMATVEIRGARCLQNCPAERERGGKKKTLKKYSPDNSSAHAHTQTHKFTPHTRVLHGELSWEGRQFHLREL